MPLQTVALESVLRLHDRALEACGGLAGVRDLGALAAAVERPHSGVGDHELFPTVYLKAAAVAHGIATSHPFVDGNKRTALLAAAATLEINGLILDTDCRSEVDALLAVATHEITLEDFAAWLEEHSMPVEREALQG